MHYLDSASRDHLEALRRRDPFVHDALQQLDRILGSPMFARLQQQTKDFLAFIVTKALMNQGDEIKETTIAVFVFGEPANFNPAETAKIRVAAIALRERVARYYRDEGQSDPIRIVLPTKGYVPRIHDRRTCVLVNAFENWNPDGRHMHLCVGIRDEMVEHLNELGGWIHAAITRPSEPSTGARFIVRGSVELDGECLRVNISVGDVGSGRILYSRPHEGLSAHAFGLARRIAEALIEVVRREADAPNAAAAYRTTPARAHSSHRRRHRAS